MCPIYSCPDPFSIAATLSGSACNRLLEITEPKYLTLCLAISHLVVYVLTRDGSDMSAPTNLTSCPRERNHQVADARAAAGPCVC